MSIREWLRRWLGIDEQVEQVTRLRDAVNDGLKTSREEIRSVVDLETERHRATGDALRALDLKHTSEKEALVYRLDVVTDAFQKLRTKVDAGPEPVTNPIMCPNGHTGLVMAVGLAKFDAKDPSKSEVIGGGFSCPKCGSTFYADREGRWLPAEAAAPPGESPAVKAQPESRLRVRSRRGEEM